MLSPLSLVSKAAELSPPPIQAAQIPPKVVVRRDKNNLEDILAAGRKKQGMKEKGILTWYER